MTELNKEETKIVADLVRLVDSDGFARLKGMLSAQDSSKAAGVEPAIMAESCVRSSFRGGSGVSDDSSSSMSWADMVEEEGPVVGVPAFSDVVKASVVFGGFGEAEPPGVESGEPGLMQQFVRTGAARGVRAQLAAVGIKMPKSSAYLLAMCTHTAATMPVFFRGGKEKLKVLALLGDAALLAAVCAEAVQVGRSMEVLQYSRSTRLTDVFMMRAFADSGFASHISVGTGQQLNQTKTGATALEAIAGLVAYYCTPADVVKLAKYFRIIPSE